MEEYTIITMQVRAKLFPEAQTSGALTWIAAKSLRVEPAPLRGKVSRDPDDNVFVATELAVEAQFIITQDRDLLVLGKPFGIAIITPVQLIRLLKL